MKRNSAQSLIFLAAAAFAISIGSGAVTFLSLGDATPEAVAASVSVASFFMAGAAILAAAWTVGQQHEEALAQRQTETMHLLTGQYEALFDDIHRFRGTPELRDPAVVERFYNRYFTIQMRGFSAYLRSLVSDEDFEDWTATTLGRFYRGGSLLNPDSTSAGDEMLDQWRLFDSRGAGPRDEFRKYMRLILGAAPKHAHGRDLRELAKSVIADCGLGRRPWWKFW